MAIMPTDDPLGHTVGVRVHKPFQRILKSLKRDALLFDQIGIPVLTKSLSDVDRASSLHELFWLRDIGIVRNIAPLDMVPDDPTIGRQYLTAFAAETGEPIDVTAIPDERVGHEVVERVLNAQREVWSPVLSRMFSIDLRHQGINAFPILEAHRQIGDVFPSGTAPVLEVILKSMPIPDDQTPWEDIIEFRNDPESMKRLRRLRVWVRKFAKGTTATSLAEMKEEIEVLLDEYEEHMKLHRMKVNKGATETLLTGVSKLAEDLVKLKWGDVAKLPFIFRERKISLLEAEAKAPNRELAVISMARERFSR